MKIDKTQPRRMAQENGKMRQTAIKLGDKVADKITGFDGVVTSIVDHITGSVRILVQPRIDKDGSWVEGQWFDEAGLTAAGGAETSDAVTQIDRISRMPAVSAHAGQGDGSVADAVASLCANETKPYKKAPQR